MKPGETIVKIDGRAIKGLGLDEAANRLQGAEGTAVDLEVKRGDGTTRSASPGSPPRRRRERGERRDGRARPMASAISSSPAFRKPPPTKSIERLMHRSPVRECGSLVIDLRGNPGGLLNVAVEIAERFIDQGLIVSTRGRAQGQTQSLAARGRARWRMPIYVLVDHDSASASEILAGALQDHRRATILGARTYGKGSVQSIFSLRSAPAGLKLTTAKFYSPLNRPYSEQGVQPDIPITVRSAAKPAGAASPTGDDLQIGDPDLDIVLSAAIRTAKERAAGQ